MTATLEQATDDMLALFKAAWDTTGHPVGYVNVVTPGVRLPPSTATPWARVAVRHVTGRQATLSGALGKQRYERTGFIVVSIFVPTGEGLSQALSLAKIVSDAYEGVASPNGVWFKNVRTSEVGPDGDWYQVNTLVDFTYDEVK